MLYFSRGKHHVGSNTSLPARPKPISASLRRGTKSFSSRQSLTHSQRMSPVLRRMMCASMRSNACLLACSVRAISAVRSSSTSRRSICVKPNRELRSASQDPHERRSGFSRRREARTDSRSKAVGSWLTSMLWQMPALRRQTSGLMYPRSGGARGLPFDVRGCVAAFLTFFDHILPGCGVRNAGICSA